MNSHSRKSQSSGNLLAFSRCYFRWFSHFHLHFQFCPHYSIPSFQLSVFRFQFSVFSFPKASFILCTHFSLHMFSKAIECKQTSWLGYILYTRTYIHMYIDGQEHRHRQNAGDTAQRQNVILILISICIPSLIPFACLFVVIAIDLAYSCRRREPARLAILARLIFTQSVLTGFNPLYTTTLFTFSKMRPFPKDVE